MSNKPLIGMNADYRAAARSMPAYSYIAAGYFQSIIAAGGIPVVLPPMDDPDAISQVLDQLNGFVMIGGADLDPRNDGFMLHPSVRPLDPVRETSDRLLMADIAERRMPVLGIGTGMQLLNVQQGGNLFLHIKEPGPGGLRIKSLPLNLSYAENFDVRYPDAYERLLMEVARGNLALFMRREEVEAAWKWVDDLIEAWDEAGTKPVEYAAGSDGPVPAAMLLDRDGRSWWTWKN